MRLIACKNCNRWVNTRETSCPGCGEVFEGLRDIEKEKNEWHANTKYRIKRGLLIGRYGFWSLPALVPLIRLQGLLLRAPKTAPKFMALSLSLLTYQIGKYIYDQFSSECEQLSDERDDQILYGRDSNNE